MGTWQVRTFTLAAIIAAVVPVITEMVVTYRVHAVQSGLHFRADLPGGFVLESRLESADQHVPTNQCMPGQTGTP